MNSIARHIQNSTIVLVHLIPLKIPSKLGTGLIGNHFIVDARISRITSDGFIDRASSDLKSFYISAAYLNKKSSLD
jgi:iron complex outermembrane receptor protein